MFPPLLNHVEEIMVTKAITASPDEFLADAARRMEEKHVGCLAVVIDRKVIGIISERDFVCFAAEGADPGKTKVRDKMIRDPVT